MRVGLRARKKREGFQKSKKKVFCCLAFLLLLAAGCGGRGREEKDEVMGTLSLAIWDNAQNEVMESEHMVEEFQKKYPGIDIEVEKIKDDSEYWNIMEMRAAAGQLPDIMLNKPFTLAQFQEYMVDLSGLEAAQRNQMADEYRVEGKVVGIPITAGYEYVYYWKDMFRKAQVEVPQTWEEFEQAAQTLQEYYGEAEETFAALACGLKDEWPSYPYMEFMPSLIRGNGKNWDAMAGQDAPFAPGTDIYQAYEKVSHLFSLGVLGKNPLNLGSDQATDLFAEKKAAMVALGDWGLLRIKNAAEDVTQLGCFYLPIRESREDPYYIILQGDCFMGITEHSANKEAAKAFVEWFFSEAWYPKFIESTASFSVMPDFGQKKDSIMAEADELCPERQVVVYGGGGADFTAIQNEAAFDYKKLGAEMAAGEFTFQEKMEELNQKWVEAREKLGYQKKEM